MIKITGIAGSPRRNGNSTMLLNHVLIGAEKAGGKIEQTIFTNDLNFSGCQNCGGCISRGRCVLKDNMTPVYDKLTESDIWVFSTPVYYDNISGQLKLFFDRLRPFSKNKERNTRTRTGAFICTYEDKYRDEYTDMIKVYIKYLSEFGIFVYTDILEVPKMKNPGDVLKVPSFLQKAEELGSNLVIKLGRLYFNV